GLKPDFAENYLVRGDVLQHLRRYDEALASYDRALAISPQLAEAWGGRADALSALKRSDDAFAAYDKALALKPDMVEVWVRRGHSAVGLRLFEEARFAYEKALAIKPDVKNAASVLSAKIRLCDWENFDDLCSQIVLGVRTGENVSPFLLFGLPCL